MKKFRGKFLIIGRTFLSVLLIGLLGLLSILVAPSGTDAAELTSESVALDDPTINKAASATDDWVITLSDQSTTALACVTVEFDTNAAGTGGLPLGMVITGAQYDTTSTFFATPGDVAETVATNIVTLKDATPEAPAGGAGRTIILDTIQNGDTDNTTYFIIVNTYSDAGCTTAIDTNGKATFVFTEGVVVSATVDPTLTFTLLCNAGSCASATNTIPDTGGSLSSSAISTSNDVTFEAYSNATGGYIIGYNALQTLTSGANTIDAISSTTSTPGSEQFGFNLTDNAAGGCASNTITNSGADLYGTAGTYDFDISGAGVYKTIVTSSGPSTTCTWTVNHMANISTTTQAGVYTTSEIYRIVATY